MAEYLISNQQLQLIHNKIFDENRVQEAKVAWESFSDEQKNLVYTIYESLYPSEKKLIKEEWYNTVMDILGIFDPTPVVDIINSVSYFSQGEQLFGILTLIGAVPYVGDALAKPLLGSLKIGSKTTKNLDKALKIAGKYPPGSKQYLNATKMIEDMAKQPNLVGTFIQKMGGDVGDKALRAVDSMPGGVLKGMKNTMMDYLTLLSNAGKKSKQFQGIAKSLAADFKVGKATAADVKALKDLLKGTKIFDTATLSKPGFLSNTFFGGIPRLFRSPEGRRIKVMMGQTKWWLGFLDYIGIGNFVGPEEISSKMSENEFMKKLEEYNKTPQAKKYFDEQFGGNEGLNYGDVSSLEKIKNQPKKSETDSQSDPLAGFLRNMLMGKLNPIPGI